MNYFELYESPVAFTLDDKLVKKKYLELSRKFHPDFYVNEPEEKQTGMLELATLNTRAFQTLSDFDTRMKYILELKNQVYEGERYELPPSFLMEMMEMNEGLMELQLEPDPEKVKGYGLQLDNLFKDLYEEVRKVIENYDDASSGESELKMIKEYFYKKKYLLRIQQSLDTFAARS